MSKKVIIRNFSNVPLTLKLLERFDPDGSSDNNDSTAISTVTSIFSKTTNSVGLTNNTTRAAVPQIDNSARPFTTQEYSIQVAPFGIVQTDILASEHSDKERFRLSFEAEDGHHQMLCPVPTQKSADLAAPPNAVRRLTGIYLTNHAFVALYNSSNLSSWMSQMPPHLPLSFLSIPGTHNSPAHYVAPPSIRCQAVSPLEQLQNGVRFFDLRVQPENPATGDRLVLVHSAFPISLTGKKYFRDLYNVIVDFLRKNPGETLMVSLKREGTGNATDEQLSKILKTHYIDRDPDRWYTEARIPTLGQARGKMVLLRRFQLDESLKGPAAATGGGLGIDASVWADNTPDSLCPSGDVRIQDFYEVVESDSIDQKIGYCTAHLDRSGYCNLLDHHHHHHHRHPPPPPSHSSSPASSRQVEKQKPDQSPTPLHINFLSANNFWKVGTWPEKIAARVNPACVEWLCREHMMVREHGQDRSDGKPDSAAAAAAATTTTTTTSGGGGGIAAAVGPRRVVEDDGCCWGTGILVCDWVGLDGDWDLFRCVVGMNARLMR